MLTVPPHPEVVKKLRQDSRMDLVAARQPERFALAYPVPSAFILSMFRMIRRFFYIGGGLQAGEKGLLGNSNVLLIDFIGTRRYYKHTDQSVCL